MERKLREWPLAEAKAKFSELVGLAEENGPQYVTKRGRRAAVLVSIGEYEKLQGKPQRTIKDWLSAPEARIDHLPIPDRKSYRSRKPPKF